ncbi:MAG: hypothetical protein WA949_13245 [Phormidesmis sp.]
MLTNSTLLALTLFGMAFPAWSTQVAQVEDTPMETPVSVDDLGADDIEPADSEIDSEIGSGADFEEMPAAAKANYSDGELSIDYPVSWQIVTDQNGNLQILDGTKGSPDNVVTEIFVVDSPPGVLINANIDSFISEGSAVGPYGQVTIDDQRAFTIWLADRPRTLSRAIATFIGYGDQTVMLFSSFTPENEAVEGSLLELHSSFKKVTDADTELESTEPDGTEPDSTEPDGTEPDSTEPDSTEPSS